MRSIKFAKHKILLIPLSMLAVTLIAGYFLSHMPLGVSATTGDVSLRVKDTCSMNGNVTTDDSNMLNGQEREGFHVLSLTTYCNDNAGFSIYAVGYSGDLEGSTDLTGVTTGLTISTADWADRNTGDNATKSIYSLKIEKDNTSYLPGNISILNGFTNYLAVPSTNTKVASYSSNTDTTTGSTINASYAVKVANLQAADTYTGKVKYTMVHPSSNTATGFTFDDAFQLAGKSRVSGTSYFAMQDMNAAICNKVTELNNNFPETQLIDVRDNNVYTIKKINGDCWMTQNLRFTGTTLDSTTSNVASNYTTENPYNISTINGNGNGYFSLDSSDASYTNHCDDTNGYNYACVYDSGNDTTGVWYNYAAASAGTITTDNNTDVATSSVCPKGWHIPTGAASDISSEFYKIFQNTTAGSWVAANDYTNAFKAVTGGYYYNGSLVSTGRGRWWSATAYNATYRYYLNYGDSQFSSSNNNRYDGFFVRCIADNSMQSFDSTAAASLAINESLQLRDVRDGNIYTVGKLRDGNIWLLDNLRLDLGAVSLDTLIGNTNANATTLGYLKNGGGTSPYAATGVTVKTADSGSWINTYDAPYIATSGTGNLGDWTSKTVMDSAYHSGAGSGMIGVYYNYCAASAGSYCYSSDSSSGDAAEDICPANWHLPSAGLTTGDTGTLCTLIKGSDCGSSSSSNPMNLTDATSLQYKLSTPLSSGFVSGSADGQGINSVFWSSTRSSNTGMYGLYVTTTGVSPQDGNGRRVGYSVRCLLRTE
ncbi:hypothetical protein IJG29_01670 [Candidatus Saccharibacteria bacterium]|nr:hypothetical protein [Candidatus Saccharibacteria bacterium]